MSDILTKIEAYKRLHASVWPEILAKISDCHITNYSIYLKQPENLLFGYWEYTGSDFAADAAKMATDPKTQEWWSVCMPMQEPLAIRAALDAPISPELLHRVAVMAAGGMDTLPHCGAIITLLAICKLNHRQSYADIAAVTILFPLPALVLVIVLGTVFGSF